MRQTDDTAKKLRRSMALVLVLAICLAITTFALVYSMVSVDDNLFFTGTVKINLNDGKAVINEDEYVFEPGWTVKKDFFIENESTWDVYYKIYFDDIEGGLADVLDISIKDGDKVLYSGKMANLTRDMVSAADDELKLNERKDLTIWFHYPESAGNETKNQYLTFTISADAVQTKNNPNRLFD